MLIIKYIWKMLITGFNHRKKLTPGYNKLVPICNAGHNILKLFDILPNFLFTTSETMRDY